MNHSEMCLGRIDVSGPGDHMWGDDVTGAPGGVSIEGEACCHVTGGGGTSRLWGQWILGAGSTGTMCNARLLYVGGGGVLGRCCLLLV